MNNRRLTSRDFKGAHRRSFSLLRWRELFVGLVLGLIVALVVYVGDRRSGHAEGPATPRGPAPPATAIDPAAPSASASDFSFYSRLPSTQVLVPEREQPATVSAAGKVDQPGTYWLQVGAWHDSDQAERTRAGLARQDINAAVQRVAIDDDVWYRVRVGPIRELAELQRLRAQLETADFKPIVIRDVAGQP